MRGVDASLYTETMMELQQNAKRAILKHWEVCFAAGGREDNTFFFIFFSGDK